MASEERHASHGPLLGERAAGGLPLARARSLPWVLAALTVVAAAVSLWMEPAREYHSDEGVWLAASDYYFRSYFVERDWSRERWSVDVYQNFSTRNPVVGKYAVGALVYLAAPGENVSRSLPEFKCKTLSCVEHWDNVKDRQPPPQLLARGRNAVIALGCLAALLCFVVLFLLTGSSWIAFLAGVLFAFDPLVVLIGRRILLDIPAVTFNLGCLAVAAFIASRLLRNERNRPIAHGVALGIGWALAFGCKLTNAVVVPISVAWVVLASVVAAHGSEGAMVPALKRVAWPVTSSLLAATGVCLAITVLMNPFLQHDPIAGFRHVLEFGRLMPGIVLVPESVRIHDTAEALKAIYEHNFGRANVMDTAPFGLDVILATAGGVCLLIGAATGRIFRRYASWMLLLWFAPCFFMMIAFTPFRWERWYVTLEPAWACLEALGILAIWLLVARGIGRFRERLGTMRATQ